ncbi:MAG: BMP family ABC transporter substrate-binding protein [Erysipelotrichales bacterium]|nr:BMP family ABC transporter substrate-binding protein [Erysipelotrichales bacterium]
MIEHYLSAKRQGDRAVSQANFLGMNPYLPCLSDRIPDTEIRTVMHLGVMEIPTFMIAGTRHASRSHSFANNYMPIMGKNTEFAQKWSLLYDAQVTEGIREPIKVYEYKWKFYVEEGNKRVSVLKYLENPEVSAEVIRIIPAASDDEETKAYFEFLEFYKCAPIYSIILKKPGGYKKLAEYMGLNLTDPWPRDAVNKLSGAYYRFAQSYFEKGVRNTDVTVGEAFLMYLSVYPMESLLDVSKPVLNYRLERLWEEMIVTSDDEHLTVIEKPEETEVKTSALSAIFKSSFGSSYSEEKPLKAAFMYRKSPEESAWMNSHEKGRIYLEHAFRGIVKTMKYENLADDTELRAAIDDAVEQGAEVIFTTSNTDMAESLRSALHFPDVQFFNCSINESYKSVPTYYGRLYEVKFLMGALAACYAENHKIGYLAEYPLYGTIANINAFAIGAGMIDPNVKVYLKWSALQERDWRDDMKADGIKVVCGHDRIKPSWPNDELGLFITDWEGSRKRLAEIEWNWGKYYELIIQDVLGGSEYLRMMSKQHQALNYWYGISSGVLDIRLMKDLPYYSEKLVKLLREGLVNGTIDPFAGEIHSQEKTVQGSFAPRMSNKDIIRMDWLNDNIVGEMPKIGLFEDEAQAVVKVSGIKKVTEESE